MRTASTTPRNTPVASRGGRLLPIVAAAGLLACAAGAAWFLLHSDVEVDPPRWRYEANERLRTGQIAEARVIVDRLLRQPQPNVDDQLLLGFVLKEEGRPDEAMAALDAIADDSQHGATARFAQGQIERERFRVAHAERHLLHALKLNPEFLQARNELIYIYGMQLRRRLLSEQFTKLSELRSLESAEVFLWCLTRRVDWDAEDLYRELQAYVDADPDDRVSRLALADTLRQLTRFSEALETLDRLPETDPEARVLRVRIALDSGDSAMAESLLAQGPEDHPGLARLRGRLALARRDWTNSARFYRLALDAAPDDRDALFGLGQSLIQLGDPQAAAAHLKSARALDQLAALVDRAATVDNRDDPELIRALGAACEVVGRQPEARSWYRLLIARDPLDDDAQRALFRLSPQAAQSQPASE